MQILFVVVPDYGDDRGQLSKLFEHIARVCIAQVNEEIDACPCEESLHAIIDLATTSGENVRVTNYAHGERGVEHSPGGYRQVVVA